MASPSRGEGKIKDKTFGNRYSQTMDTTKSDPGQTETQEISAAVQRLSLIHI